MRDVPISLPGGRRIALSQIERSHESRAYYLAPYHGSRGEVACLCHREGIPLGVGRRTVPTEIYYLYPLHRTDPARHAFGCPHRAPLTTAESGGDAKPLIEILQDRINVNLAAPSYHGEKRATPQESAEKTDKDAGRSPSARATLLTLLEVLWSHAELNVWRPYFAGRRHYPVVRHRLREAATDILIKRRSLAPVFFMPPVFNASAASRSAEEAEYAEFLRELTTDPKGKRWIGYVGGVLREIRAAPNGGRALQLTHSHRAIWCTEELWQRLRKKWFRNDAEVGTTTQPVFVLLRVEPRTGKNGPWLALEDLATLPLADRHCWIPVDSGHERTLSLKLVAESRAFRKPLAAEVTPGQLLPDFVLEDRADRMHLEVLGFMDDPDYRAHVVEKRAAYARDEQPVWWWDVSHTAHPPALPPPDEPYAPRTTHTQAHATAATTTTTVAEQPS